ncbi:hypothetical protein L210DRAFT_2475338 [Boletus edulis BED1]|uniref:Uncharacterized protein n=1 Tax=Boletus edulis BED1 TaxID=1328754 RepID=A0AAD4BPM1_BOLED|nr:hypothetical protein L210DRAFT_2475338 [Boletus edulis BED1]
MGTNTNRNNAPTPPTVRTPPTSSSPFGVGQPIRAPLSPPPTSPLPPLPSASLPSPTFPVAGAGPSMGTAATAAASGRMSPLVALSSSLPSSMSGTVHVDDRRRDGDERVEETWDEVEEGDTTRLSTFDAFRRQLEDPGDGELSEDEGERALGSDESEKDTRASGGEKEEEEEEEAHSDGEVGIGLSLMGALGGEDDEDDAKPAEKKGHVGVGANGNASRVSGENRGTTPMAWTRYTPTSPISVHGFNGNRRNGEEEEEGGNEEEDEDDGAYWDDIYDDYRYSRYSLASKRFSVASKASGASKASSKARANAPPMPVPPDWSVDAPRPSIGSDGTNGYPRPSLESSSSSISSSMPFTRPSMRRSASDESTHDLPLTAQFPAVPVHVPVRTESRLKIVHDGYMQGSDDHGEREQRVLHGSTEDDTGVIGLNIEVIGVAEEDDAPGQEVHVARPLTSLNHSALSPLLHTTFGSPHSSRFTDLEDGSDPDYVRRYSNKSGKSTMSSVEGPPRSPIDGGGMASTLRAKVEAERTLSSDTAPFLVVPALTLANPSSSEDTAVRPIVVDDDQGHVTGINISINNPVSATEAASQTPNVVQTTVATDPREASLSAERPDDAEKSPFLRPRPPPSHSPHPFARTSMFLPHPNAPKVAHQSQGPMYGRTIPQPYTFPVLSEPGAGNTTTHQPTPPGTTFYSTHILHQLRSLSIAACQGPARRPPMTLFARCQPELNASMVPVPILFSLDPLPPLPTPPARAQTQMGGGKGMPYAASATPTRAATVSVPVRRGGGGEGVPLNEGGLGVEDVSLLRLPMRLATNVGGPRRIDPGPSSPSLPIPREGFVAQVGAARPRSRSFSAFGARVPTAIPQERSREEPVMRKQDTVNGAVAPPSNASLPPALMARRAPSPLVLQNKDHGQNVRLHKSLWRDPHSSSTRRRRMAY